MCACVCMYVFMFVCMYVCMFVVNVNFIKVFPLHVCMSVVVGSSDGRFFGSAGYASGK